jgi:hypothetical protein
VWDDGTVTDLRGAECELCAALCYQGGARLFLAEGKVTLRAHPNPFNASTIIEFEVIEAGLTDISLYDMMGRRVATPLRDDVKPGRYVLRYDANTLASGGYLCVLRTPSEQRIVLMEVMK